MTSKYSNENMSMTDQRSVEASVGGVSDGVLAKSQDDVLITLKRPDVRYGCPKVAESGRVIIGRSDDIPMITPKMNTMIKGPETNKFIVKVIPNLTESRGGIIARSDDIAMVTLSRSVEEKVTETGDSMVAGPLKRPH